MRNPYYMIPYDVREAIKPSTWYYKTKWAYQRVSRGWSNYDTWDAGDHIAKITAEMLQHLNDNHYVDWPEWFKLNVKEEGKGAYKNLQQVIDDINGYLAHQETAWADGWTSAGTLEDSFGPPDEKGNREYISQGWIDEKTKEKISDKEVTRRMNAWHKEHDRLYKKAQKAMMFFGRHFTQFWD